MNRKTKADIDFQPGLLQEFPEFMGCVKDSVYGCGKPFKAVAAELDMSSSDLSRKLGDNPHDKVHFHLRHFVALLHATGDLRPLYWLIDELLIDHDTRQKQARDELTSLLPRIASLLETAEGNQANEPGRVTEIRSRSA